MKSFNFQQQTRAADFAVKIQPFDGGAKHPFDRRVDRFSKIRML